MCDVPLQPPTDEPLTSHLPVSSPPPPRYRLGRYPQLPLRIPETIHVLHGPTGNVACCDQHKLTVRSTNALPTFKIQDRSLLNDPQPHFNIGHSDKVRR
jgi:hypothetical protein